jgi:hypothetical protein
MSRLGPEQPLDPNAGDAAPLDRWWLLSGSPKGKPKRATSAWRKSCAAKCGRRQQSPRDSSATSTNHKAARDLSTHREMTLPEVRCSSFYLFFCCSPSSSHQCYLRSHRITLILLLFPFRRVLDKTCDFLISSLSLSLFISLSPRGVLCVQQQKHHSGHNHKKIEPLRL